MATYNWFNGSGGAFDFFDWDDFEETNLTDKALTLQWDEESGGPFNGDQSPFRIKIFFENPETIVPEDGPLAGDEAFIGGEVTMLRFFDDQGNLILEVRDFSIDLALLQAWDVADSDDVGDKVEEYLAQFDNTYLGAQNDDPGKVNSEGDDFDDIFTGLGDDIIRAKGGNDFIKDIGGSDVYRGGEGFDTVSYDEVFFNAFLGNQGIEADLLANTVIGFDGLTDQVFGIENIYGTNFDDRILGDGADNRFRGFGGDDFFNGRGGFDTVDYSRDANRGGFTGIRADLELGTVRDSYGADDILRKIEGIRGTQYRDVLRDDANDNYFRGGGGDDRIVLSQGDDDVEGNGGADTFIFRGNDIGSNYIADFNASQGDEILIREVNSFSEISISQVDEGNNFGALVTTEFGSIFLDGVTANTLTAADFGF